MDYLISELSDDGIATLTLSDPERRNAINLQMCTELVDTIEELENSGDARVVILTGAPPAFCAGADLNDLLLARERDNIHEIYRGFLRIAHSPLPTIAAVNGAAVGAGMNMALACDVIVAAESARFDSRFLQIGIHPGGGHTWRLRDKTDDQTTRAMVLFGERLDGRRAAEVGLAWKCVADDHRHGRTCRVVSSQASASHQGCHERPARDRHLSRGGRTRGGPATAFDGQPRVPRAGRQPPEDNLVDRVALYSQAAVSSSRRVRHSSAVMA